MKRKVLGWNINQRSGLGKEIPELVIRELLSQDADIIVLTEVVKNDSFTTFVSIMHKVGYEFAVSKNEKTNEVCILWKNDLYQLLDVDDSLITAKDNDNPNYLMVELNSRRDDKRFNVVGYRIRVGSKESVNEYEGRARQMKIVTEKLANLSGPTMVVTDSNNLRRGATRKEWNLSVLDSMLSEVGFNRNTPAGSSIYAEKAASTEYEFAEDHIITRGIKISDAQYDRDFVKRDTEVYMWGKDFTKPVEGTSDYKQIQVGFPDHAIIKGYFEIEVKRGMYEFMCNAMKKVYDLLWDTTYIWVINDQGQEELYMIEDMKAFVECCNQIDDFEIDALYTDLIDLELRQISNRPRIKNFRRIVCRNWGAEDKMTPEMLLNKAGIRIPTKKELEAADVPGNESKQGQN